MSTSIIYAVNTNPQALIIGDVINFGSVVRRYGCNCTLNGGSVVVNGSGYYDIDTNFVGVAGAAGLVTITLYRNGTPIPGAVSEFSVTDGDTFSVSIPAVVRQGCCGDGEITARLSGVAVVIGTASIVVEKL